MKPPRPGSATAFGVLNLVLGGLMLICGLINMQGESKLEVNGKDLTEVRKEFLEKEIPAYSTYRVVSPVLTLALAIGLIASAVGLLMVKNWGRLFAMGVGGLMVLERIGHTIYQLVYVLPADAKFMNTTDFKVGGILQSFGTFFIVAWALLVIAYGVVLVACLMGGGTARAFRGEYDPNQDRMGRPRRRGQDWDDDDDDDDRPRGRGRRREDEDDDRVRRRRDDDDDDDRPRRRPSRRDDDDYRVSG